MYVGVCGLPTKVRGSDDSFFVGSVHLHGSRVRHSHSRRDASLCGSRATTTSKILILVFVKVSERIGSEHGAGDTAKLLVSVQSIVSHEPSSTNTAGIRLLSSVQSNMTFTVVSSRKSQITHPTMEGTLRGMGLHVGSQIVGTREHLVATIERARIVGWLDLFGFLDCRRADSPPALGSRRGRGRSRGRWPWG